MQTPTSAAATTRTTLPTRPGNTSYHRLQAKHCLRHIGLCAPSLGKATNVYLAKINTSLFFTVASQPAWRAKPKVTVKLTFRGQFAVMYQKFTFIFNILTWYVPLTTQLQLYGVFRLLADSRPIIRIDRHIYPSYRHGCCYHHKLNCTGVSIAHRLQTWNNYKILMAVESHGFHLQSVYLLNSSNGSLMYALWFMLISTTSV